jgi:hypothetical protein
MKTRLFFLTVSLILVALVGCAPRTPLPNAAPSALPTNKPQSAPDIKLMATSRGDKLEATDPSTVALASGGLQLVEFFRFT